MDNGQYGNLVEVLAGLLIFSLGIPAFILQAMFPENLRPMVWRVKRFTVVPVAALSVGYLYALFRACLGYQSEAFEASELQSVIWITFTLVIANAVYFLFLCVVPPLDAARWLFKRRVVTSNYRDKIKNFEDFVEIACLLVGKRNVAALHGDFRQILCAIVKDSDYDGSSLDRFFATIKELFINPGEVSGASTAEFILECCREVVRENSLAGYSDAERANCPDVALAWESVELVASMLIDSGSLLNFRRANEFLEASPERLSKILLETVERRAGLRFASCLGTFSSVMARIDNVNSTVKARLCIIYLEVDRDTSWVSDGSRQQLCKLVESRRALFSGISADDVIARVRVGDSSLKERVAKLLTALQSAGSFIPP